LFRLLFPFCQMTMRIRWPNASTRLSTGLFQGHWQCWSTERLSFLRKSAVS